MKKIHLQTILLFITLSVNSCGEKTSKDTNKAETDKATTNDKQESEATYILKGSCDDFIAGINFSPFCFSTKKTPKYRLIQSTDKNCQYELYDDNGYHTIDFSIAFADLENMKFGEETNPELAKNIFLGAYKRKKSTRMFPSGSMEIANLGDDAYIGYNQSKDNKEQYLGVRIGNVSFTFAFKQGREKSQQSCISSNTDLEKIGRLVIDRLKELQ